MIAAMSSFRVQYWLRIQKCVRGQVFVAPNSLKIRPSAAGVVSKLNEQFFFLPNGIGELMLDCRMAQLEAFILFVSHTCVCVYVCMFVCLAC